MKQRQALAQPLEPSPIRQKLKELVTEMDAIIDGDLSDYPPHLRSRYIVARNLASQSLTEWGYANRRLIKWRKQERQERKHE